MPTYDFDCKKCGAYEVIISITKYTGQEPCPTCSKIGERVFVRNGMFMGAAVQSAEYNPGLGCVTKNKEHRAELCKKQGLVELGNERPGKAMAEARKKKRDKPYLTGNEIWNIKDSQR